VFYGQRRGQLDWDVPHEEDLMDAQRGTGGSTRRQVNVQLQSDDRIAVVDNERYIQHYGDPGGCNNCLIDSLRQCLGLSADCRLVREDLMRQFRDEPQRIDGRVNQRYVGPTTFLSVNDHWQSIIRSLFRHNTSNKPTECNIAEFCVISLSSEFRDCGVPLGETTAANRLVVINLYNTHFNPFLLVPRDNE